VNNFPGAFYTAKQLKEIDRLIVSQGELSGYQLMCRAGQAALTVLKQCWPTVSQIAVFCGPGNNGGDGFVLARVARSQGLNVTVYEVGKGNEKSLPIEAAQARQDWLAQGEITPFDEQAIMGEVVVDALLGIGAHSPLSPALQKAITAINQSQKPVLALDIPSGLQADTGAVLEACVKAEHTLTFIGMKLGLACGQGIEQVGELHFDSLGISCQHYPNLSPVAYRLDSADIMEHLPHRHLTAHKGEHGHVGVIGGGQTGYCGAVCLAGEAALRAGAGLVSAVVAPQSLPLLARSPAELMCYSDTKPKALQFLFKKITVFVLGPGLSETPWGKEFFKAIIPFKAMMVVDADGLNWLARYPQKRNNWILTPHPGEAARLLKTTVKKIQDNRLESVKALQEKFGGVIVLKGAGTLIAGPDEEVFIQMGGFPVLATGGTGDVLAGLIGGLLAQGVNAFAAAKIAVSVHANAAQLEESMGARGMLASDLFLHIRSLLNPQETFP
jgi:ADP-dependent NAD(P)H-hydrate dehydratase / NAD(P)H-hydrate epimerase